MSITVTRSGDVSVSATVQFATADVSALNSADYGAMSGILTFAPGETSKTFFISITDDATKEATETFNIVLSNATNAKLGSPTTATVSITDNDKRTRAPRVATTTRSLRNL